MDRVLQPNLRVGEMKGEGMNAIYQLLIGSCAVYAVPNECGDGIGDSVKDVGCISGLEDGQNRFRRREGYRVDEVNVL